VKSRIAIIPNEDYLTKDLVLQLAATFSTFEWYLLDADRGDLKTKFHLTLEEEQLFKGIDINIQFVNDRFLEKQNWIENEIKKIQPDIVFTFSAANYSYRCIRKAFPDQRIYVLQSAFLKSETRPSLSRVLKVKVKNFIKGAPVNAEKPGFFQPHPRTLFGIWSESFIPPFLKNRIRYKVVGNFNIDSALSAYEGQSRREIESPLRAIYMTQPISLYYGMESHQRNVQVIEQIVELNKDLKLAIKMHPRESKELYEALVVEHPESVNWAKPDTELHSLLKEQDLLITHYSATIDTAVAMNIPVVCIDPQGEYEKCLPVAGVYVRMIKNAADLNLGNSYFTDARGREAERREYLSQVTGHTEGKSLLRVGESLLILAGSTN